MESSIACNETDSNKGFDNYENFRKLYATLSVTTMMGSVKQTINTRGENDLYEKMASVKVTDACGNGDEKKDTNDLPDGWEKHEDDNGPYYWHIPTGTIQREVPSISSAKRESIIYYEEDDSEENTLSNSLLKSNETKTFLVYSLGWMEFDETQLTPSLSSKAIQRCILELSTHGDNAVRCWGKSDTKQLIIKIENSYLKIYDKTTNKILNLQPINTIRVWGVNDNNDFAFVARDPPPPMLNENSDSNEDEDDDKVNIVVSPQLSPSTPPILKCHVFHCDIESDQDAARSIATLLRDEVIRLKSQEELKQTRKNQTTDEGDTDISNRPQNLYIDEYNSSPLTSPTYEFPTPIEEPKKTIIAKYIGKTLVSKPVGVNVLNEFIGKILNSVYLQEDNDGQIRLSSTSKPALSANTSSNENTKLFNIVCLVHISPSTIQVESTVNGEILMEFRVRYLSFLGIYKESVKNCGFIIQVNEKLFEGHCFECEPTSGPLCKTIEAACKLRYQKCLDAHRQRCNSMLQNENDPLLDSSSSTTTTNTNSGFTSTIKNVFSKFLK